MPYRIQSFDVPENVRPRNQFNIFTEVFCEDEDEGITIGQEEGCGERNLRVKIKERRMTGLFGIWKFPILNRVMSQETLGTPIDATIDLDAGETSAFRGNSSIERPGEYEAVLTLGDITRTETFSVQE